MRWTGPVHRTGQVIGFGRVVSILADSIVWLIQRSYRTYHQSPIQPVQPTNLIRVLKLCSLPSLVPPFLHDPYKIHHSLPLYAHIFLPISTYIFFSLKHMLPCPFLPIPQHLTYTTKPSEMWHIFHTLWCPKKTLFRALFNFSTSRTWIKHTNPKITLLHIYFVKKREYHIPQSNF